MENLLPRVRVGTYESLTQSLVEDYKTDGEFILKYLENIEKKNPVIRYMMMSWIEDLEGKEYAHALMGLLVVYRLLESEAEAIQFEKEMEEADA